MKKSPAASVWLFSAPPKPSNCAISPRDSTVLATPAARLQKLRFQYGVLEKQFRRFFAEAQRRKGVTGEILLQMLELRLDNVCYRMGFANTRFASRQLVAHRHITVNGKVVNIASYQCKAGDVVAVKAAPRSQQLVGKFLEMTAGSPNADWMTVDRDAMKGTVNRAPVREEIAPIANEQLVVELYSR